MAESVLCTTDRRNITEIAVLEGEQMEFNDDTRKQLGFELGLLSGTQTLGSPSFQPT